MNPRMTREQRKKLLLAEGTLQRFECVQARRAIGEELGNLTHGGPAGMLRAFGGRGLLSLAATALPLVLGAGRVARLIKRGMLVAGGVAAAWSAISKWREQSAQEGGSPDDKVAGENEGSLAEQTAEQTSAPPPGESGARP